MTKRIWAPWRMEYIARAHKKSRGCLLCRLAGGGESKENLVLFRGHRAYIVLNRYPYSNGHLMIVPRRHVSDFEKLEVGEHAEIAGLVSRSVKILKRSFKAEGFNIGINLGRAAGAGIVGHVHYHVVPRWVGDSNYMPIIGNTRVIPEYLERTYKKLKGAF